MPQENPKHSQTVFLLLSAATPSGSVSVHKNSVEKRPFLAVRGASSGVGRGRCRVSWLEGRINANR